MENIIVRVERNDIAYLKYIFEGYEGMAIISTKDPQRGHISIQYPLPQRSETQLLIRAMIDEKIIKEVINP